MHKKVAIVAVLGLAVFATFVAPLAGQLNVRSQSLLYKVSTTRIAYQVRIFPESTRPDRKLNICRIRLGRLAWLPGGSFLRPSPSKLVEAR